MRTSTLLLETEKWTKLNCLLCGILWTLLFSSGCFLMVVLKVKSLKLQIRRSMLILVHQWISFEQELKQAEQAMMMAESG